MFDLLVFLTILGLLAVAFTVLANSQQPVPVPRPAPKPTRQPLPRSSQPLRRQAVAPVASKPQTIAPRTYVPVPAHKVTVLPPLKSMSPHLAPAGHGDLIAIIGFADKGYLVLPPTPISAAGVRNRVDELPTAKRLKGGQTDLSAGLDVALPFLEKAKPGRIKKLVIVSDGEPNEHLERLPGLADRARKAGIRICAIHCGPAGSGSAVKALTEATPGGWYTEARSVASLADAIRTAAADTQAHQSGRKAVVVFAVDGSTSMMMPIDTSGTSRIEALRKAIQDYLTVHISNYGKH